LSEKAETDTATNLYYVFVNLNERDSPEYHIVPRAVVAKYVRKKHAVWGATPRRDGKPRGESRIRVFRDEENKYQDRWDLLGLDPKPV
jgi:hypothetical protein